MTDDLLPAADSFPAGALRQRLAELAAANIYAGTSSWKYDGWIGQLYHADRYLTRGKLSKKRFEAECLAEYAETFPSVCVDGGYYQFPSERYLTRLRAQVPDAFKFSFKVTDEITIKRFTKLARHGARAGQQNSNFLNADLFAEAFLGPCAAIRDQIGCLIFEFSTFYPADFARGRDFVAALDAFLGKLPGGWQYGIEIRNPAFLVPDYFDALRRHGAAHVFNNWSRMPPAADQIALPGAFPADFYAARFLLRPGRSYAQAVESFSPYREIKDPYPEGRDTIRKLTLDAGRVSKRASYVYVNNRFEGNALQTILLALDILESQRAKS